MSPRTFALQIVGGLALSGAAALLPAWAQQPAAASPAATLPNEPAVQHTRIEDEGSRVEEVRIRGEVRRITVTPKVGTTVPYEVLPAEGSRDLSQSGSRGVAGQRVWHILTF
jgi:hypothetical protein